MKLNLKRIPLQSIDLNQKIGDVAAQNTPLYVSRVAEKYESHVINAFETIFVSGIFSSIHVRLTQIVFFL